MTITTALIIGSYTGMHLAILKLTKISEDQQRDREIDRKSLSLLESNLLQTRMEGAQAIENQRTMFQYLDGQREMIQNITNALDTIK